MPETEPNRFTTCDECSMPEQCQSYSECDALCRAELQDAPANDWPRPGDVGYMVVDWDPAEPDESTTADLRRELRVFFVPDRNGALHYVDSGRMTDLDSPQSAAAKQFTSAEVKRTFAGSLRETARQQREYGQKCLALADTLERLAAESEEGGNGDG